MAKMAQIADSFARTDLPDAKFDPNTATGDQFGAGIGRALEGAGSAMQTAANFYLKEQAQTEDFKRKSDFIDFSAQQEQDMLQRAQQAEGSDAKGFTQALMTDFDKRSAEALKAVPEGARAEWEMRYKSLRNQIGGNALKVELNTRDKYQDDQVKDKNEKFALGVDQNPEALENYRKESYALIDATTWGDGKKEAKKREADATLERAYGIGRIRQDPEGALEELGVSRGAPVEVAKKLLGLTEQGDAEAIGSFIKKCAGISIDPRKTAWCAAFMNAALKAGGSEGSGSLMARSFLNVGTATNDPQPGDIVVMKRGDSPTQGHVGFFMGFTADGKVKILGGNQGNKVSVAAFDAGAVLGYRQPPKAGGEIPGGAQQGGPISNEAIVDATATHSSGAVSDKMKNLSYREVLSLRGAAEQEMNAQQADRAKIETANYNNAYNALRTNITDGKATAADVDNAREAGWLKDYRDIDAAYGAIESRDKKQADTIEFGQKWNNEGSAWNQFDDRDQKRVEAGFQALGGTPAAAGQIFDRTGIMPKSVNTALRGGLASNNVEQVTEAATVAYNAISKNPNAFDGVEGGKDIEGAGLFFKSRIDAGMTAEAAAKEYVQRQSPDYKAAGGVKPENIEAYQKQIKEDATLGNTIIEALDPRSATQSVLPGFMGGQPKPKLSVAPNQVRVLSAQYSQFTADRLRANGGDEKEANTYAMNEMKKVYGVSNNTLIRFPPEKAYIPVPDGSGDSFNYIYKQAMGDIRGNMKHEPIPETITLVPMDNGVTQQSWRDAQNQIVKGDTSQWRAPRYNVFYAYKDEAGQTQYGTMTGFYADPAKAQQENAERINKQKYDNAYHASPDDAPFYLTKFEDRVAWAKDREASLDDLAMKAEKSRAEKMQNREALKSMLPGIDSKDEAAARAQAEADYTKRFNEGKEPLSLAELKGLPGEYSKRIKF